jgi:hypothetical protein
MSDNLDLTALHEAAEAVQNALVTLIERVEAVMPAPAPQVAKGKLIITFGLPPDLIAEIDAIAAEASHTREQMIESAMRQFVSDYRHGEGEHERLDRHNQGAARGLLLGDPRQ